MAPLEMHLKSLGDKLEVVPKFHTKNISASLRVGYVSPKCFGSRADDLPDLN